MPTRPPPSDALALPSASLRTPTLRTPISTGIASPAGVGVNVAPTPRFAVEPHLSGRRRTGAIPADPAVMTSVLAQFARLFVPFVLAELRANTIGDPGDTWIDQTRSPLGRRLHCALARSGALPARKMGRRWLVRVADVDAFIVANGRAAEPAIAAEDDDPSAESDAAAIRKLLASCGETVVAPADGPPRKKARR